MAGDEKEVVANVGSVVRAVEGLIEAKAPTLAPARREAALWFAEWLESAIVFHAEPGNTERWKVVDRVRKMVVKAFDDSTEGRADVPDLVRARVVRAVKQYNDEGRPRVSNAGPRHEFLVGLLKHVHPAFASLSDAQIDKALSDKRRGPVAVAAHLAASVRAFGTASAHQEQTRFQSATNRWNKRH